MGMHHEEASREAGAMLAAAAEGSKEQAARLNGHVPLS